MIPKDRGGGGGAFIVAHSLYPDHFIPRCQHLKTNGTQCGSPSLKQKRFCYFHNRWSETHLDLNSAGALRVTSTVILPVLEDADSIQVALMQIMRLILCRQLDNKIAGLLLYALQTASANLRHTQFEPRHKPQVVIDPKSVSETGVGDDAWEPADFTNEDSAEEEHAEAASDEEEDSEELPLEVRKAIAGAERGNGRDLKTVLELAGIFPPKPNGTPPTAES